jgi:hypothetical protein
MKKKKLFTDEEVKLISTAFKKKIMKAGTSGTQLNRATFIKQRAEEIRNDPEHSTDKYDEELLLDARIDEALRKKLGLGAVLDKLHAKRKHKNAEEEIQRRADAPAITLPRCYHVLPKKIAPEPVDISYLNSVFDFGSSCDVQQLTDLTKALQAAMNGTQRGVNLDKLIEQPTADDLTFDDLTVSEREEVLTGHPDATANDGSTWYANHYKIIHKDDITRRNQQQSTYVSMRMRKSHVSQHLCNSWYQGSDMPTTSQAMLNDHLNLRKDIRIKPLLVPRKTTKPKAHDKGPPPKKARTITTPDEDDEGEDSDISDDSGVRNKKNIFTIAAFQTPFTKYCK